MITDEDDDDPAIFEMVSLFPSISQASESKLHNLEMKGHNDMRITKGGRVIRFSILSGVVNGYLHKRGPNLKAVIMDEIGAV